MQGAKKVQKLKKVKTYVVDKFHAHRHSQKCPASPLVHRKLARAIQGTNTSAAEQTFAWLRKYGNECGLTRIPSSGVLQNAQPAGWQ